MSIMLALATSGGGQPLTTKVYASSQTVTIPAGVTNLALVSGQGAPGTPAWSEFTYAYREIIRKYVQRNDLGGTIQKFEVSTNFYAGLLPNNYCEAPTFFVQDGVENAQQFCHEFSDASFYSNYPATNGSAASGFGKTFPGGVGGPAVQQTFKDVAVTPGQQFTLTIPAGASISISYYG